MVAPARIALRRAVPPVEEGARDLSVGPDPVMGEIGAGGGQRDGVDAEADPRDRVAGQVEAVEPLRREERALEGVVAAPAARAEGPAERIVHAVGQERRDRPELRAASVLPDPPPAPP